MKTFILTLIAGALLAAPAGEEITVDQKNMKFSHTTVNARVGDKLVFHNADDFAHNLYSVSPGSQFGSYMQQAGTTVTVPLTKEGDFEVECAIHPKMKLLVEVRR